MLQYVVTEHIVKILIVPCGVQLQGDVGISLGESVTEHIKAFRSAGVAVENFLIVFVLQAACIKKDLFVKCVVTVKISEVAQVKVRVLNSGGSWSCIIEYAQNTGLPMM